jgi:hypothetical protein
MLGFRDERCAFRDFHSGWKGFVSFAAIVGGALTYYINDDDRFFLL